MNPSQPDFWTTRFKPSGPADARARRRSTSTRRSRTRWRTAPTCSSCKKNDGEHRHRSEATPRTRSCRRSTCRRATASTGIGGTQFIYGNSAIDGEPPPIIEQSVRSFGDVLRDVFAQRLPDVELRGQRRRIRSARARPKPRCAQAKLQQQQQRTTLRRPRDAGHDAGARRRPQREHEPEAGRGHRKARELAEQRLEAEEKRFTVGLSTTFELLQAQRDLVARAAERAERDDRLQPRRWWTSRPSRSRRSR